MRFQQDRLQTDSSIHTSLNTSSSFCQSLWHSESFQFQEPSPAYHSLALEGFSFPELQFENEALREKLMPMQGMLFEDRMALYTGNAVVPGWQSPISTLYAGHQFGYFNPQLGDGRAALVGCVNGVSPEVMYPTAFQRLIKDYMHQRQDAFTPLPALTLFDTPMRMELQLKGSGQTPYSRMGDGRSVWRSSLRETVASEAMFALGIPTTRALALACDSTISVYRETIEPAAMVLRVAPHFMRPGHIEYWGMRGMAERVHPYLNQVYQDYFGSAPHPDASPVQWLPHLFKVHAMLQGVVLAQWQSVGFCHGVMNSDNASLLGLTLDYGPYGFMDGFDMGHICNHSDTSGRYSYRNQPAIAQWNLERLLDACAPLVPEPEVYAAIRQEATTTFQDAFNTSFLRLYRMKLGLNDRAILPDIPFGEVLKTLFQAMHRERVDYTRFFWYLPPWCHAMLEGDATVRTHLETDAWHLLPSGSLEADAGGLRHWLQNTYFPQWQAMPEASRIPEFPVNPALVPRNTLLQELIEHPLEEVGLTELMEPLFDPFAPEHEEHSWFCYPLPDQAPVCVSCSS
jgi:serine/tyrosine/threonine adenylyltransferase